MVESNTPATPDKESRTGWSPAKLYGLLQGGEPPFVLDVRAGDEFEAWQIEGRGDLQTVNIPYYEMLEVAEHADLVDTFQEFLSRGPAESFPKDAPVLVACAKGDTSEFVAEALRRLDFDAASLEGGTRAWGNYYHVETISESAERTVLQILRPARGCLSYVISSGGKAAVIDPLRHVEHYLEIARERGWTYELILDTHAHADHISGGPELSEKTGAPYYLHPYDGIHPIDVLPAAIGYEYLRDGAEFTIGTSRIETFHIPGHTLGNVAYRLDGEFLFTGDSIFLDSIARPDLGGRGDTWAPLHHASLRRLLELGPDTVVLPAHFAHLSEAGAEGGFAGQFAGRLGDLKEENEGLRMALASQEEFVTYILASLPEFPDEYVDIKRVNAGLRRVDDEAASELELGKNICALAQAYQAVGASRGQELESENH